MPEETASLDHLPDDPSLLKGIVRELLATHRDQQRQIDQLTHRLDLLLKRTYGPRADTLDPRQLLLFAEPPAEVPPALTPLPEPEIITKAGKKSGHGRRKLPTDLRRETEIIDIPESVQQATGGEWTKIGEEISEKLDYTPWSLFVRRIVRPKYVVRFPNSDRPDELKIAELPPEALPKSKAAPGLVADVIVSKLVDLLSLYRQEQRYARQGFSLARSTLCGWLAEAAHVLTPLWRLLRERVLAANTDDTPVPVQDPDRDHCRAGPLEFLRGFQGFLQCDAYAGYDELFRRSQGAIIEVGCWAGTARVIAVGPMTR